MGARDYWDKLLVYFGIAESGYDEDSFEEETPAERRRASARDTQAVERRPRPTRPRRTSTPGESVAGVGIVPPRTFNDAQKIADQFKDGRPVIVNLQATDSELSKRLIDFASGLTYGLDGSMQRIADKVFLLTPPDVDVSAEDRAALLDSGFFNQS